MNSSSVPAPSSTSTDPAPSDANRPCTITASPSTITAPATYGRR